MADDENILGGKLSLEDNYSSILSRFANSVIGAENKFKQFADNVIGSNNKIGSNLTKTQREVDKFAQKFIQQGNSVSDAINKANEKVKQNQEKTIDGLTKKYLKLGMTIQDAYSNAQKESNSIWNGGSNTPTGGSDDIKDFAQNILSGGFSGIVGKLGLIGVGVTATVGALKKIDGAMDTGFDVLNKLSDNMFSYDGIKESMGTAMEYQTTRAKLDLFYDSESEGKEAYQLASKVALDTFADPQSLGEAMSIMKKNGITTNEDDLYSILDMVGARGDGTSAKEAGLAIEDAMNGEWERLKEYSITTTKLKNYVKELQKSDKSKYKEFKNVFNKQGSVTDSEKAYQLILDYVRNSEIQGYSKKYAETAQGSIDNIKGLWEQIKVSIMGLDDAGDVVKGSALFEFSDMVNNLKETLGGESATKGFLEISKGLGEGFEAFNEAFQYVLTETDWEEVAKAISESIGIISKSIIDLSNSGALKDLADNLPSIVDRIVASKIIKTTSKVESTTEFTQGNFAGGIWSWLMGGYDRILNFAGIKNNGSVIRTKEIQKDFYSEQSIMNSWMDKILHPMTRLTTDRDITNMLKDSSIDETQKQDLKNLISKDDSGYYNIRIDKIEANNFDEIMESIIAAQNNQK